MRPVWRIIGFLSLGLAAIGTALPVVPTVPFLLVAAWAFTKSSPELREKIRNNPRYGPIVVAWQDPGEVPRLAKIWAIVAMSFGVGLTAWLIGDWRIVAVQAVICAIIAVYLITRPEG